MVAPIYGVRNTQ